MSEDEAIKMRAVREINAVSLRRFELAFVGAVVADPFELDNARPARPWISFYESRGPLSKQDRGGGKAR